MDTSLKQLFKEGWIPAPDETDEKFWDRIEKTRTRLANPQEIKNVEFDHSIPPLLIFRSNEKLPFWTGAMTWIVSFEDGSRIPLIQIPTTPRRYTLATEKEIIDHERVHALRVAFQEPIFEEILAYRTSPSKFRQFFGPLLATTTEGYLFFFSLPLSFLLHLIWLTPLLTSLLLVRLLRRQLLFSRALKSLQRRFSHPDKAILFLSDREIKQAAKGDLSFIDQTSLRMQFLELTVDD